MRGSMRRETSSWPLAIGPWVEASAEDTAEGGGATRAWAVQAGVTASQAAFLAGETGSGLEATAEDTAEGTSTPSRATSKPARAGDPGGCAPGSFSGGCGPLLFLFCSSLGCATRAWVARSCVTASQPASLLGISDLTGCGLSRRSFQMVTKSCCK